MNKLPSPNEVLEKFFKWFNKEKKTIFIISFIIGLLVNLLVITNDIISTDSILMGEAYIGGDWDLSIGRWMLKFLGYARFALCSSVVNGILSVIITSFTGVLLIDLFKIKNKIFKWLTVSLIMVSPFFTQTLLSPYCSIEYSISFLLSVLSIHILYNCKNKLSMILLSSLMLSFSLGIYQAYLGVACGLCILIPLTRLLRNDISPKEFIKLILISILMGIFGIILYEIFLHICLSIFNVSLSSYGGANEIGLKTIINIPSQIKNAYLTFYNFFINDKIINNMFYRRQYINILLAIILVLIIIKVFTSNKNRKSYLFTFEVIISILLIPLSVGILVLIAPERDFYILMSAPYMLIYIFIFSLIDDFKEKELTDKIITWITLFLSLIIIVTHLIMTNATYMSARITKDKTLFAAERIVNDIYNLEGFDTDLKVIFVGRPISKYFKITNKVYELSSGIGFYEPQMWEEANLCNDGWIKFIKHYLGIEFESASMEDYENIIRTDSFKTQNTYPNNNYIQIIDDIIVIKI